MRSATGHFIYFFRVLPTSETCRDSDRPQGPHLQDEHHRDVVSADRAEAAGGQTKSRRRRRTDFRVPIRRVGGYVGRNLVSEGAENLGQSRVREDRH